MGNLAAFCLRHSACRSEVVPSLDQARRRLAETRPDVLLVDVTLSDGAAISLLQAREDEPPLARIALVRPYDRWSSHEAFGRGADQVVTVPFTPDELAVRAFALLRRFAIVTKISHSQLVHALELSIDEKVGIDGRSIRLTPAQNSLLYVLAANAGTELSAHDIRQLAWGLDAQTSDDEVVRRVGDLLRLIPAGGTRVERRDHSFRFVPQSERYERPS